MGQGGRYMDSGSGGRRTGQSGGGVHVRGQAEGRNTIPTSVEPAAVPVATQLQGAQVNMSGNPQFTNIGVNKGKLTAVNNYGGTHGVSFSVLHRLFDLSELKSWKFLFRLPRYATPLNKILTVVVILERGNPC
ncbi:hypothetical protein JOM56_001182 [Amanita muscaria]